MGLGSISVWGYSMSTGANNFNITPISLHCHLKVSDRTKSNRSRMKIGKGKNFMEVKHYFYKDEYEYIL